MLTWEFPRNEGGETVGLNDAGIETFRGAPYSSLARECSQNSLDAVDDSAADGVRVSFRLLEVPADEVPDLAGLKETLEACRKQAFDRAISEEIRFFDRALQTIGRPLIRAMVIEDFGTKGAKGPPVEGSPFHALVKSRGISRKANVDAGGSFGIGKNAVFAVSNLRTVFYSTAYSDDSATTKHLMQGKSVLISRNEKDVPKQATGYWGESGYQPVEDNKDVPEWLVRRAIGTTVVCIGFREDEGWQWQIVESLIRNFFSAVHSGSISFSVECPDTEGVEVSASTLEELFECKEVREAAEDEKETEFSKYLLQALKSGESKVYEKNFDGLGTFKLHLLVGDGLPQRVGIMRNGMLIADNLKSFGHKFARFPMCREFVALVEPADTDASRRIRDMENPSHDALSAERIDDTSDKKARKKAMRDLGKWIRGMINTETKKVSGEAVSLGEMNRFFAGKKTGTIITDSTNRKDNPEKKKIDLKTTKSDLNTGGGDDGDSGSSGGRRRSRSSNGQTSGERHGKGRGASGGRGGRRVACSALRNQVLDSGQGRFRRIGFTPQATTTAEFEVVAVGISRREALSIKSINGKSCAKKPSIELRDDVRVCLDVEFDYPYFGPVEVVLTPPEEERNADQE